MKYCIFKNNVYTGLAYTELTQAIKDFHNEDLIVELEESPVYKVGEDGKVLETFTLSESEAAAYFKEYAISDLKSQLRSNDMVDAQMKCFSEGLVFAEKYPTLAAERIIIVDQINSLQD